MQAKFTKLNFMQISQEVLDLLKDLDPVKVNKDPLRVRLVYLNYYRNYSTFLTIRYLVEHERVADIYSLSRSMFDSVISMGLLSKHLIQEDIERYQDFQYIETYKTYNHLKQLSLERLSCVSPSEVDDLYGKRNEYIKKWGQSTSTWTGLSLEQNVKLVDKAYAPPCNFYEYLYCQVYREGSQAAHSSFRGLAKGVDPYFTTGEVPLLKFKTNEEHLIFA